MPVLEGKCTVIVAMRIALQALPDEGGNDCPFRSLLVRGGMQLHMLICTRILPVVMGPYLWLGSVIPHSDFSFIHSDSSTVMLALLSVS